MEQYGIRVELGNFSGYLGYLVLGYALANTKTGNRKGLASLAIVIGYLITVLGTYYQTHKQGTYSSVFYNPLTPHIALMASGIFYLFRHAKWRPLKGLAVIVAANGYNIYLCHVLVILVLTNLGINEFLITPALGIPLLSLLVLIASTLLALVVKKSFLGKYIAG